MYLNDLQKCKELWKTIELDKKRDFFDEQGLNIVKVREQTANSRKNLATLTKNFKKLNNDEKLNSFSKLLKSYQDEIDSLTNRGMNAEKLFLELYQPIREAPDPYHIICKYQQMSQQQASQEEYENTIKELKKQLTEYEHEFTHLKNQEVTIRKLEEEILKYKNQNELSKEHELMIQKFKDRELIMQSELKELKNENDRLSNLYNETQNVNYELKTKIEEIEASKQYQSDMHHEQVLKYENEILELKSQAKSVVENSEGRVDEELMINEMKTEYLTKINDLKQENREKMENIQQLQDQIHQQHQLLLNTQHELNQRPSREEMSKLRERIDTLQQLEFGYDNNLQEKTVEQLLKEKVMKLENDLTKSNQNNREKEEKIETLNTELTQLSAKTKEQASMIERLESNVDNLMKSPKNEESTDAQSLISILTEQRNRFRDKNNVMEEQYAQLKQQMEQVENEVGKLRKENLKLYEKTKYLQSFGNNTSTSRNKPNPESNMEYEPIQNKYEKLYEQELDPFKRFHKKEREDRLNNMNAAEKLIYRCSGLMLSHKLGRLFLFFYLVTLHTLVFFTLSKLTGLTLRKK
ncbi:predicted protein [Naegleria gruberi]|uniref:Protein CASP n=1 Tax=Naegleria gruberi TaxID=5762 RepID=D2V2J7_NAEGR|nr:uncharacterized protein NAEGRDRAFT_30519 [Naegleria gruberi]EFC49072.1 predicted protein [Naegleria gruberi]|eukprot:XP_002681816.1 predicted protein [Naegleria gruberi strain NEG-M]